MQFKFKFIVGETAFEIADEASTVQEFFEKVSFWQELPTQGPNGETDLAFHYRKTPNEGYEYYSLVSKKAGMEFRFGQPKKEPGVLFPKGWAKVEWGQDRPEEIDQQGRQSEQNGRKPETEQQDRSRQSEQNGRKPESSGRKQENGSDSKPAQKANSTTFWAYQKAQGIAKVTASEIIEANTNNNVTDWSRALQQLQQAG